MRVAAVGVNGKNAKRSVAAVAWLCIAVAEAQRQNDFGRDHLRSIGLFAYEALRDSTVGVVPERVRFHFHALLAAVSVVGLATIPVHVIQGRAIAPDEARTKAGKLLEAYPPGGVSTLTGQRGRVLQVVLRVNAEQIATDVSTKVARAHPACLLLGHARARIEAFTAVQRPIVLAIVRTFDELEAIRRDHALGFIGVETSFDLARPASHQVAKVVFPATCVAHVYAILNLIVAIGHAYIPIVIAYGAFFKVNLFIILYDSIVTKLILISACFKMKEKKSKF